MVNLLKTKHPNKSALDRYDSLVGINDIKNELFSHLVTLLDNKYFASWKEQHGDFPFLKQLNLTTPLVILEGEVGCGKTALAQSIASPLAQSISKDIFVFETPSDIRGGGLVGEISKRITSAFDEMKRQLKSDSGYGLLIIDEADDIATNRAQNQAHHEDRAGLNVLLKELDALQKEKINVGVVFITNRIEVIDPALFRRVSLHLRFDRPKESQIKDVLEYLFPTKGDTVQNIDPKNYLAQIFDFISKSEIPYSFSDLIQRVGKKAVLKAIENNQAFTPEIYWEILRNTIPTPLLTN